MTQISGKLAVEIDTFRGENIARQYLFHIGDVATIELPQVDKSKIKAGDEVWIRVVTNEYMDFNKDTLVAHLPQQPNPPEPSHQDKDGNPVWEKTKAKLPEKFKSNDIAPDLDQVVSILNALIDVVREMKERIR